MRVKCHPSLSSLGLGLHAHDHALERSRGKYLPIVWRADLFSPRVHQQLGVGHQPEAAGRNLEMPCRSGMASGTFASAGLVRQ